MAIATGTALAIAAATAAGSQVAGAKMASGAATDAARTQSAAATRAADLQGQASQQALAFNQDLWRQTQQMQQPYLQAGQGALGKLAHGLGVSMPQGGGQAPQAGGGGQMPMARTSSLSRMAQPMVLMEAPTGEQQQIPESEVPRAEQAGARRVDRAMPRRSAYRV